MTAICYITVSMRMSGRIMHCHRHKCTIETSQAPYSTHDHLRIRLDEPYSVDWGTLATGALHVACGEGGDACKIGPDVGKHYQVKIEIEAAPGSTLWPPLKAQDLVRGKEDEGPCSHIRGRVGGSLDIFGECPH